MDSCFYNNIIEAKKKENSKYSQWIQKVNSENKYFEKEFYHCNIVRREFDNWIKEGMK